MKDEVDFLLADKRWIVFQDFLMGMVKHFQSTQNIMFLMPFNYRNCGSQQIITKASEQVYY